MSEGRHVADVVPGTVLPGCEGQQPLAALSESGLLSKCL